MEWIDINDRLPEKSGAYLCFVEEVTNLGLMCYWHISAFTINDNRWFDDDLKTMNVTNWMPLPPKPLPQP